MTPQFKPLRTDWVQASALAAALFLLYAFSAPRTVSHEDDGLFILSAYFLGIEHPPGYPVFTLIGHLFTWLPIGSVAYRVHLAASLFGALSCALAGLCARTLTPGRLPAALAALALGFSPVFWSQSIIAEVYTLNTFFFLLLAYLALRGGSLPWMAVLFGLSLANHYPLMLLVAPAFAILLWPRRAELFKHMPLLACLVVLGLTPYAWLIVRSWAPLPISFYGALETLEEVWFFLSRGSYREIDRSATADWLDRIKFFRFQGLELVVQFAGAGTLLAAAGFAAQWRALGRRVGAFLSVAFLMPSAVLILLLGFDYDLARKHMYHVYPLPAYAAAALWMALGFSWLVERYALRRVHAAALCTIVVGAIFAVGARANLREDHEWGARWAQAVLGALPKNAVVLGQGDPDLVPMAYFHIIENVRPDITLYHPQGIVLGNRLFHPMRTDPAAALRIVSAMIEKQAGPVVSTFGAWPHGAQRERWLYSELDKSGATPKQVTVELTEEARSAFEKLLGEPRNSNGWVRFIQGELRRSYAVALTRSLSKGKALDARTLRHLDLLSSEYTGALGIAEGMMLNPAGYSARTVMIALDRARGLMPADVHKEHLSRYFYVRGALRAGTGERRGAILDLETAISIHRLDGNPAIPLLEDLYRQAGDQAALEALKHRFGMGP